MEIVIRGQIISLKKKKKVSIIQIIQLHGQGCEIPEKAKTFPK